MRDLVHLCHHRWSIPVLGVMSGTQGGRYAMLRHRLGLARETLRRAIGWLEAEDYVMPNPGYGHPLRPELLLTPWGEAICAPCRKIWKKIERAEVDPRVIGRKWSIPTLLAILVTDGRYSQLDSLLEGCSPRALSQTLHALEEAELIERRVVSMRPVRAEYWLTKHGRAIAEAGLELAIAAQG